MNMGVPKNAEFYADSKFVEMGLKNSCVKVMGDNLCEI